MATSNTTVQLRDIRRLPLLQQLMAVVAATNFLVAGGGLAVATGTPLTKTAITFVVIAIANILVGVWLTATISSELKEVND